MKRHLSEFWTFFVTRFRVTLLVIIFLLTAGLYSYRTIARETEPTVDIPMATVMTVWPGASAIDVEKLVTNKLETEIKSLDHVKEYTSSSLSGVSVITVEFEVDSDKQVNIQKLRDKVDDAVSKLPGTLPDDPSVSEVSLSDVAVVNIAISGNFSWSELKRFAEILEDEFSGMPNVKDVILDGIPEDEIHIALDPNKLSILNLGVSEVLQAVRAGHQDMPLGMMEIDGQTVEITARAEYKAPQDISEVPIIAREGGALTVGDLGEVRREFKLFEIETYFQDERGIAPSIKIEVTKSAESGNVLIMVESILNRIEELKAQEVIPRSLNTAVTYNRANEIRDSLDTLINSGGQTVVLIMLAMFLFVGWRESVLASIVIPLSMLSAVMVMQTTGGTFNGISLFSLVLGLGLLVDNAIVIVEGMSDAINEKKMTPEAAAEYALETFRWPLISGTATTVCAFLPMTFFISGVMGDYIAVIPNTVNAILISALFIALWLLPSVGVQFLKAFPPKKHVKKKGLKMVQNWYARTMQKILAKNRYIFGILGAAFIAFFLSIGLVVSNQIPVEVFPSSDMPFFTADFEFPEGTDITETKTLIEPIAEKLRPFLGVQKDGEVWVESFVFTVGKSQGWNHHGGSSLSESNILGLGAYLTDVNDREIKSYDILPLVRDAVVPIIPKHVEANFSELEAGPPTGDAAVSIRLIGPEYDHLEALSLQLQEELKVLNGPINVRDDSAEKTFQLTWTFNRDVLTRFGITPVAVMETLRTAVNGTTAVKITEGDNEVDVVARINWDGDRKWDAPDSLDVLNQIEIKTPSGKFVTLAQIATSDLTSEVSLLRHRDGLRTLTVLADMKDGMPVSVIQKEIDESIRKLNRLPGEIVEMGGDTEEGDRLMGETSVAMGVAVLLILVVLVTQFNSYWQAFTTLIIVPLSLTGVFVGFWLHGLTISFPTMIGIVSLAGIIVNDAIVLIDYVNKNLRQHDLHWREAYVEAGRSRLQPIFLTSITTVVGLLPLSFSDEMWAGLGFAIIYGMSLSTILTLLLVPCFLGAGQIIGAWWRQKLAVVRAWITH
jgi:multidrug efflux pump subunit AcrB